MSVREEDVTDEAISIGKDLLALEKARSEAEIAWSNEHFREETYNRFDFHFTPIAQHLDRYREQLRRRLLELPAEPNEGDQQ